MRILKSEVMALEAASGRRGLYFVFEGIDGCGKDAQLEMTTKWLKEQQISPIEVREPDDDPIVGSFIRDLLNKKNGHGITELDSWQQAHLYNSARRHVMRAVRDLLEAGCVVLSSRNWVSTMAYQGWGAGLIREDLDELRAMCQSACLGVQPDSLLLFDLEAELAFERMKGRQLDEFERLDQTARATGYRVESQLAGGHAIDARRSIEEIHRDVQDVLTPHIQRYLKGE